MRLKLKLRKEQNQEKGDLRVLKLLMEVKLRHSTPDAPLITSPDIYSIGSQLILWVKQINPGQE